MGNNVSTLPSSDVNKISINWVIFNPKEKEIDAKKLKIGKGAYVPEVEDVQNTYIIEKIFRLGAYIFNNKIRKSNKFFHFKV